VARLDRHFWLAVLITACVVVPRAVLVSRAHSECWDDQTHLSQGLSLLTRAQTRVSRDNPPLGQAVISLPLLAAGALPHRSEGYQPPADDPPGAAPLHVAVLYGQKLSPETLLALVAVWKAVLFLPFAGLVFHWCRLLYGLRGGWLGLALVLVDPTLAGHTVPAALDVIGAEITLAACFLAWRYFESPGRGRLVAAGAAAAAAMLTKHTAIILPGVIGVYGVFHWLKDRRAAAGTEAVAAALRTSLRTRVNQFLAVAIVAVLCLWPLTGFDVSRPADHAPLVSATYTDAFSFKADVVNGVLTRPWPAGVYLGSVRGAQEHAAAGHPAYLWGRRSQHGWWYYYPAVALYKVPAGVGLVMLAAAASLWWVRPKWGEVPLVVAAVAWAVFLMAGGINIGFRHFLPAYVPMLVLAARSAAGGRGRAGRLLPLAAWVGVAAAALHVALWHPDYLSYINWPRDKPYLAVSDSNVDWGQGLKQLRRWLDDHPRPGRTVWLRYFGNAEGRSVPHYLGGRVKELNEQDPPPAGGVLVISPVWVAGAYGDDRWAFLREREPDDVIGHCLLVYDLDRPGVR
jgi:hypothetical protein